MSEDRYPRSALAGLGIGLLFVLLAAWSWGKWTDVQVDWGMELYNAWRIAEGDRLYSDIAYRQGGLSPHVNAALFALFGVSMRTLVVANLAVLAAIAALLHRIVREARGVGVASLTTIVFLTVFAFSQYTDVGNYNYVTPYLHHQTHGLLLALAAIASLARAVAPDTSNRRLCFGLAGLCLGGVFPTKVELFVPTAAAGVTAIACLWPRERADARRLAGDAVALLLAALVAPATLGFVLALRSESGDAWAGVLGNWLHLGAAAGDPFYRGGLGLDRISENLVAALRATFGAALVVLSIVAVDRRLARSEQGRRWGWAAALALCLFFAARRGPLPWLELPRALPIATALAVVWLLPALRSPARSHGDRVLLIFGVFALGLLPKMFLDARIYHYGFVLAMPATLLCSALLVSDLPERLASPLGFARNAAVGVLLAGVFVHLGWSNGIYERKTLRFEAGADRMWVEPAERDPRGHAFALAIEKLSQVMRPGDTLAVVPEGAGLNFWLRRPSSSRHLLFVPTELRAFGGAEAVLADLRRHPPDFVVLVDRPQGEYGVGSFGSTKLAGRAILEWVRAHYRPFAKIGGEPFEAGGRFGMLLMRARPVAAQARR